MILDLPFLWPAVWLGHREAGFLRAKKTSLGIVYDESLLFLSTRRAQTHNNEQASDFSSKDFPFIWTSSMISVQKFTKDLSFRKLKKYVRLCVCPGWREFCLPSTCVLVNCDLLIIVTLCVFNLILYHTCPTFASLGLAFYVCHFRRLVSFKISSLTHHCVIETASLWILFWVKN